MKIGIYFGDNDFWKTITSFLYILQKSSENHHANELTLEERFTKERIVTLYNNMVPSLYWLAQNGYSYELDWDAAAYLATISIENIYINNEVDVMLQQNNNGEFHYITLQENTGECTSWI